ncbi:alpha/beta hydrolase [Rhizobium leguminosarum]|uniref:alpha/beta fold hydrolase n=1 Tax=Rhizobium leguminosarum TaxID=384 RepID=UPI0024A7F20F|nr:alpha/beta hydrolase [Rhizobium leguminosarum]MDI5929694.1 alpha/beta hydrolase [Rhizobium leguminosarum]
MRSPISIALAAHLLLASTTFAAEVEVSDDLTIHYELAGSGPTTILLVPGWTMSSEVFEKQLDHFKQSQEYRVIPIDPRGQGQSTKTAEGNFYEQHGRDLAAVVSKLDLRDIVLVGWSSGGQDVLSVWS